MYGLPHAAGWEAYNSLHDLVGHVSWLGFVLNNPALRIPTAGQDIFVDVLDLSQNSRPLCWSLFPSQGPADYIDHDLDTIYE